MREFIIPPEDQFEDYTLQARFALTWKMIVFTCIFSFLLIWVYLIFDSAAFEEVIYAFFITLASYIFLYKTRRYKLVGFVLALHSVAFFTYTLNTMPESIHAIEFFWLIVFVIYTFFAVGRLAGYFILLISVLGAASYFIWSFDENMRQLAISVREYNVTATILNISVASLLIAYLINQFVKLTKISEEKFIQANKELQNQNRLVQAQNEEKTIMLKEIHHRVKNNLQVISSLLRLQSHEIPEETAKVHFQDAVYRVVAMALIHEKMYQNKNLSRIDITDYLESLAEELITTYADQTVVSIKIDSALKSLGNDTLVPVALIFNELITNSLKHAFTDMDVGLINVELTDLDQNDSFKLIYKDNGNWAKNEKQSSFGLELIATLTEQLDGRVKRTYEDGTKYDFQLKNSG